MRRSQPARIAPGDPWYSLKGPVLVRRLSPNNRKLELDAVEDKRTLVNASILRHMGRDLAAIHLGITNRRAAIQRDLDKRADKFVGWVRDAAEFVCRDQQIWQDHRRQANRRR